MAGIRKRTNTWQVRWQQSGESQLETFDELREAQAFREAVEAAGNRWPAEWVPGKGYVAGAATVAPEARGVPVREYVAEWMREHSAMKPHAKETAQGQLARRMRVGALPDMNMADVTQADVQQWVDELREKYAPNTVRVTLCWVGAGFNLAVRRGIIRTSPMVGVRNPGGTKTRVKPVFLTQAEEARLVAAIDDDYRLWLRVMLASGLRYGECWALFPHSVLREDGVVTLEIAHSRRTVKGEGRSVLGDTKTEEPRPVALPHALGEELFAYAAGRDPSLPLFDLPVNTNAFRYGAFARACERAQLVGRRKPRIHDMRHTHASRMLAHGMPIASLSERLGHASITTTADIYGHLARKDNIVLSLLNKVYVGPEAHLHAV